jgi:hypothetical protein
VFLFWQLRPGVGSSATVRHRAFPPTRAHTFVEARRSLACSSRALQITAAAAPTTGGGRDDHTGAPTSAAASPLSVGQDAL